MTKKISPASRGISPVEGSDVTGLLEEMIDLLVANSGSGTHKYLMQSFWEWIVVVAPNLWLPLFEGDVGRNAFIVSQNRSFKDFLKQLLLAQKITDPQLVQEAKALIADQDNHLFNFGEELLKIASRGRGRMTGGDILQAATEAAGRMWERLWSLDSYPGRQTWESRFPRSIERDGILGTVRSFANNLVGHFAQKLRKSRAAVSTFQRSQIEEPMEPASRPSYQEGE